jgi:cytochrome c553
MTSAIFWRPVMPAGFLLLGASALFRAVAVGTVLALAGISLPPARAADSPEADPASLVAIGQRIYRDGVLPDGSALQGVVGGAVLSGALAACEACHRRSGMGSREGQLIVAPITGPILCSKTEFHWPTRPGRPAPAVEPMRLDSRDAYDDASLARAIRFGVDSKDRPLAEPMPRYALSDVAMRALSAYLWQLSARTDPGLSVNGGHRGMALATIVTPDADPARRDTVVQTLKAWADDRRPDALSPKLQIWQLGGDASTWRDQLEALYRAEPVFAVLSGAGGSNWAPVRDFCDAQTLPCLFPVVDAAPNKPGDGYTVYFDTGVAIEAAMLAQHVASLEPPPRRVVQLVGGGRQGAAAQSGAAELAGRLADAAARTGGDSALRVVKIEMAALDLTGASADPAALASAIKAAAAEIDRRDLLVAWLAPADLKRLALAWPALFSDSDAPQLIASARLAAPEKVVSPALAISAAFRQHLQWVSTRSDPGRRHGNAVIGLLPWLQRLGLEPGDEALQAEVYAATYFFSDALARMRAPRSREYLIEMLESTFYSRPAGAAFYTLSLGPRQRVAVKGGQLLGLAAPDFLRVVPIGARIVPGSE